MARTRLSSKGQVIIPKEVRDSARLVPGMEFEVESRGDEVVLRVARPFPRRTVEELAGIIKYDGPPVTLEDMERAIESAIAERWAKKSGAPRKRARGSR